MSDSTEFMRAELRRDTFRDLNELEKLIRNVRNCIEKTGAYPLGAFDLEKVARGISAQADAHGLLAEVERQESRARRKP